MDWFIEGKIFSPSLSLWYQSQRNYGSKQSIDCELRVNQYCVKKTRKKKKKGIICLLWCEGLRVAVWIQGNGLIIPFELIAKTGNFFFSMLIMFFYFFSLTMFFQCLKRFFFLSFTMLLFFFFSVWKYFVMDYENESPPEVYHHLLLHNRHIVYEIKLSLILILGTVIILICVMYIVSQCKRRRAAGVKCTKNRCSDCDRKALLQHSSEVSQMLTDNEIIGKTKIGKEFFVWNDCYAKNNQTSQCNTNSITARIYVFIFALCIYSLWGIEYSLWRFP